MSIPRADGRCPENGRFPSFPSILPSKLGALACFSLDISGVAGLLGGDGAISAMTAVHIYGNNRLLGWYNTPGSFQIAKRLNLFALSTPFREILTFEDDHLKSVQWVQILVGPTSLLGLDGYDYKGPKFRAACSGTIMEETGYVAALFVKLCAAYSQIEVVQGWKTQRIGITIADLGVAESNPADSDASTFLFSSLPMVASVGACAVCGLAGDWYALSSILAGIIANGISCFILGSSKFEFTHPDPAKGSPRGDGILGSDKDIVLLRGEEHAVNSITRGKYTLRFSSETEYNRIRWCPFLFFAQSIIQLFLIPQASLFGQIMFLFSLGVSALYNNSLSSLDREEIHRKFLFENVLAKPKLTKYMLGTRTAAVVFMLLVLQPPDPEKILHGFIPNDTKVWRLWKETVVLLLQQSKGKLNPQGTVVEADGFEQKEKDLLLWKKTIVQQLQQLKKEQSFQSQVMTLDGFVPKDKDSLDLLYEDVQAAYEKEKELLLWKKAIVQMLQQPREESLQQPKKQTFQSKVMALDGFVQEDKDLLDYLYQDAQAAYEGYIKHFQSQSP